jgi:hypothetical protein
MEIKTNRSKSPALKTVTRTPRTKTRKTALKRTPETSEKHTIATEYVNKRWTKSELDFKIKKAYSTADVDENSDLPLGYVNVPQPISKSVNVSTITMQDDSMFPVFSKGDILTIGKAREEPTPGYYYLIRLGGLLLIRRFIYTDNEDWLFLTPFGEIPIEDNRLTIDFLGVVTAVQRVDGAYEVLDLDKLKTYEVEESEESKEEAVEAVCV